MAGLAAIALWQPASLPREHPPGGLDGNEQPFASGRVYLWYAIDVWGLFGSGRAVYLEQGGMVRRRVCGEAGSPVESFRVIMDIGIECQQGGQMRLVDANGDPASGQPPQTRQMAAEAMDVAESVCRPAKGEVPTLSCGGVASALEDLPRIPGTLVPTRWDVNAARYFRNRQRNMPAVHCIEVPADAMLRDGTSADATVLVFHRPAVKRRAFWLVDRAGSCARVHSSLDTYYGLVYYEWHPNIAPYHGEKKSELF